MNEKKERTGTAKSITYYVALIILVILLPLNAVILVATFGILKAGERQMKESIQNTADLYVSTADLLMKRTDSYLYRMYSSNQYMNVIRTNQEKTRQSLEAISFSDQLQDDRIMEDYAYAYFFYFPERDIFLCSADYDTVRDQLEEWVASNLKEERWSVKEYNGKQYLYRLMQINGVYYGAMFDIEDIVKDIEKDISYAGAAIRITAPEEAVEHKQMVYAAAESSYKNYQIQITVPYSTLLKSFSVLEVGMIFSCLLSFCLVPLMFFLFRKLMIRPLGELNTAHKELENGNEDYRIEAEGLSREMDDAYESFNHMADNIYSLKLENMEKELEKNKLLLHNLQLQIRPHFLLNTFNLIYNLSIEGKNDEVKELILYLSNYFRHIFRSGKELELFSLEMALINGYIRACRIRYPGMLDFVAQVDPEVNMVRVPPLLIHNFVENIIKHAMVEEQKLSIMLTAEYEDGMVTFEISDDGRGMSQEETDRINSGNFDVSSDGRVHVGMENSMRRLRYFYGDGASITVESELGVGTVFTICIPYNLEENEV